MEKLSYLFKNWKFVVHLLLKTKYFGVNNQWCSSFPSAIGWGFWERVLKTLMIVPIIRNYQSIRMRVYSGWITKTNAKKLFKS